MIATASSRTRARGSLALLLLLLLTAALAAPGTGCAALWPRLGRLGHEVPTRPGVCAWAPDGGRLACIENGGLQLFDAAGQRLQRVAGVEPSYLDWAPGAELLVVSGVGPEARLLQVRPGAAPRPVALQQAPAAARWWGDGERIAVVAVERRPMSIGLVAEQSLLAVAAGQQRLRHKTDAVFPTRRDDVDLLSGWMHAGPRPVAETLPVLEFHDPPRFPPFLRLLEIDPVHGEPVEWTRFGGQRFGFAMSWSPDGKRLALTAEDGGLVVVARGGEQQLFDPQVRGTTPSWHPHAELVHLGGWLLPTDGGEPRLLLHDAPQAVGFWSPDGGQLALVDQGDLYLFDLRQELGGRGQELDPAAGDLQRRLRLLRRLRSSELIDDEDYDVRRDKLLRQGGLGR